MSQAMRTNIPQILRARGHSVKWFCQQIEIDRSYFYRMESGERPVSADYIARASHVLNLPAELLFTSVNSPTSEAIEILS